MRIIAITVIGLAAAIFIVVGGFVNAWYGWELGQSISVTVAGLNLHAGYLFAAAGLAFDGMTCIIPACAVAVLAGKKTTRSGFTVISAGLFLVAAGYSLQASSSAMLLAKTKGSDHSAELINKRKQLEASRAELRAKNPWTPEVEAYRDKPAAALDQLISAKEADSLFRWSQQCTKTTTPAGSEFCAVYHALKQAKAIKEDPEIKAMHTRLDEIEKQLSTMTGVPTSADPVAAAQAAEVGLTDTQVRLRSSMYISLAIELFKALSMAYLAWFLRLTEAEPTPVPVAVPVKRATERRAKRVELAPVAEADVQTVAKIENKRTKAIAAPIDEPEPDTPDKVIDAALKVLVTLGSSKVEFSAIQDAIKPISEKTGIDIHPITLATALRKRDIAKVGTRPVKYLLIAAPKKKTRKAA
jgi:hypothetical protein